MGTVKIRPMRIPGNWKQGFVLDYHTVKSDFLGYNEYGHPIFDTKRSEIGELLYQLKYHSNRSVLDDIIETASHFILSQYRDIDAIVPVPPSRQRAYQPVLELARGIAERLIIPFHAEWIVKTKETTELKNIYDYNERLVILEHIHEATDPRIEGTNILLFDDLYRSGATMNAVTMALYDQGKAANVYAFAITRTRSG